jgi:hypothetical protein
MLKGRMMRAQVFLLLVVAGCTERNAATCLETHCPDPAKAFCDVDGSLSGEENSCIAVECSPGEFKQCRGDVALTCNSAGNSYDLLECEFGCEESVGCKPCTAGPQCEKQIVPRYLLTVCNQLTDAGDLLVGGDITLDTTNDLNCSAVVSQSNGPQICVVHQRSVTISANRTLKVIGPRAFALVADRDLNIEGVLDVSADGGASGPGGGFKTSGVTPEYGVEQGGGGAGGATAGGAGADTAAPGGAANGGDMEPNPATITALVGGTRATPATYGSPGGGGGAVTVLSCRGTVSIRGTVDAGGGGGEGEKAAGVKRSRATGGGSGGTIVIQGLNVSLTGTFVANGGGGGSIGTTANQGFGFPGQDGTRSTSRATGGVSSTGDGGFGGAVSPPTPGGVSRGAGGGAAGFVLVYSPSTTPTLDPFVASPKLEFFVAGSN